MTLNPNFEVGLFSVQLKGPFKGGEPRLPSFKWPFQLNTEEAYFKIRIQSHAAIKLFQHLLTVVLVEILDTN